MERIDVRERLQKAPDLPALPQTVSRLLEALRDPDVRVEALSEEIAFDQALAARILRLVNSSFYGLPNRVADLRQAVVVLGLQTVQNVVLSISLADAFRGIASRDFPPEPFWVHTIAAGLVSQRLAARAALPEANDAFVAGLLHDIGKLLLLRLFPEGFAGVLQAARAEDRFIREVEKRAFTVGHAGLGGWLAAEWRLPEGIVHGIRYHHAPGKSEHPFAAVVHVADALVRAFGVGSGGTDLVPPIDAGAWRRLGLDGVDLDDLVAELHWCLAGVGETAAVLFDGGGRG
ncbi:HDOD domain-containing protein [Dissulfurirhabdus thermomarina]|uniref:HDOD domain-containing protein n=1 Tax=Dissulfurirhabdus thermomarina TaxID=1765737 RepID=A0A6N9TKL3_DISTH|nr:HDOD domain-containing protein [Dissulfurirhabdus thermomarina]NDY41811.1 HDOD domain-containing protein [Dissulfurirhabdus thermomarina]NMX24048.1 HDOD domain-containing protein [Dissulfurirhabdus thermomarina]